MRSSAAVASVVAVVCACEPNRRSPPRDLGMLDEDACARLDADASADIPDAVTDDTGSTSDAGPDPFGGELRAWMVRRLRFVDSFGDSTRGFDVDQRVTSEGSDVIGCGHQDMVRDESTTLGDPLGIDSVLGRSVVHLNGLLRLPGGRSDRWLLEEAPSLRVVYREWAMIFMVVARTTDAGFSDDATVEAYLFEGRLADGINLTTDESGLAAPGQLVRLGAGRTTALHASLTTDGRLVASAPYVDIAYPTAASAPIDLAIHDVRLHADLAMDGAGPGLLGGYVPRDALTEGLRNAVGVYFDDVDDGVLEPADGLTVEYLLDDDRQRADIELDGASCNGCEAFSVSLDLETVPVLLEGSQ